MSTVSADAVLTIENLSVAFGGNRVLDGLNLDVGLGFTGLVGPNGAGKTTVFNVISGYVKPQTGDVRLYGESLLGVSQTTAARKGIGRTFQTPKLIPELSLLDNVMLGYDGHLRYREQVAEIIGFRRRASEARGRALELLRHFNLATRASHEAGSLPLGSQKIVEVARALMSQPRLLLLDEPAAGLGAEDVERMIHPLSVFAEERDLAVVIIEHDLELVGRLCPARGGGALRIDHRPRNALGSDVTPRRRRCLSRSRLCCCQ